MRTLAVALVATVALGACGSAAKPPATPVAVKNDPPPPPAVDDGWVPYESAEGGFRIRFPGTPTPVERSYTTAAGEPFVIHIQALDLGTAAYLVGYQIEPPSASKDPLDILDGAQHGMLESYPGATVLVRKDIKLDGNPCRELTTKIVDPDATQYSRYCVVGDRLIQVATLGAGDGATAEVKKFFESFALIAK